MLSWKRYKDRPTNVGTGNYVQWKSRIKRYIDTKPNNELIHHVSKITTQYHLAEKIVPLLKVVLKQRQRGTPVVKKSGIQCYNCMEYGIIKECSETPKRNKLMKIYDDESMNMNWKLIICTWDNFKRILLIKLTNSGPIFDDEQCINKYNDLNLCVKVEIDCAKARGDLMSYKIEFEKSSNAYTRKINDLNQMISDMKKELCAHQETISIMSQAKEAQIKLYKTREDKELDKVIALENKVKFLKKAQRANPRLYDIGCYNDYLALIFIHVISDESGITHTEVSSPFEDLSDIGSPRADDHELLELPYMPEDPYLEAALQAPPSPDYVPGPEEPEHAPPSPDYVPGAEHADDEIVAEDQPYAEDASPIAQSPDYVPESDPEADPEEDDDEDPEEDPIDYPADGGDDGDDEMDIEEDEDADMDIDSDEEDEDDEMDVEIDEEAEEEHSAPAYPVVVALPATAPSVEETEPFETDESAATPPPHPAYRMTARITIPEPLPVPAWSDSEVARLLAISSPPASPLSPWSSSPPQIPFPLPPPIPYLPLPLSPPSPVLSAPPPSPIRSLGYRAAMIRMRAKAAATSHSLPLPPPFILSPSCREDRPEVNLPPRKRLGIALGPRYEVGESSAAAAARPARGLREDYGFIATMDREIRHDPERDVGYRIMDSWDEIV
ncbi:hypothetical protein Tco_1458852, partial [Tanacetum coccineum]